MHTLRHRPSSGPDFARTTPPVFAFAPVPTRADAIPLEGWPAADRLLLSLATVKWHLHNLYAKLGVGSRTAALAKARANRQLPEHDKP